jgi:squalene/oxidosqualene cyclase-like protein
VRPEVALSPPPPEAPWLAEGLLSGTLRRGLDALAARQGADGSFRGEYGGPMFLLPMYVAACHFAGRPIPAARRAGMIVELKAAQQPDGSLGLHREVGGCMFTSALGYVALRLLDVPREDPALRALRRWILTHGTALGAASWGKFTLALLNLYDYEGLHPVLPELWLLPRRLPVHPGRLWCHARQVYLPMAFLYGMRARVPVTPLIAELRADLYDQPYATIDFRAHRDHVAPGDAISPTSQLLAVANGMMGRYEDHHSRLLRDRALESLCEHLDHEDRVTSFIRIGPVNAVLNTIAHQVRDPGGAAVTRSFATLDAYLWDEDGRVSMNGYNSTALWDTAFAVQAILATPHATAHATTLRRAYEYLRHNQVLEDVPDHERFFRHPSRGGWPFSDRAHGWPISDCTAEGLKAALALEDRVESPISATRLEDAVRLILSWQNADGGWATYERTRGPRWLEQLNPSQVFADIMIDYSYVECTSACLQGLAVARRRFPGRFDREIDEAVRRGGRFIRAQQRDDGSWEGKWGVCFTYGTWFGVTALRTVGAAPEDSALARACEFLTRHQHRDGGWGEDGESCRARRWVDAPRSSVVNTAWALSSLVRAGRAGLPAARRAAAFLAARQASDGSWPREPMAGVFNRTALINYDNYPRYFPIWALGEYFAVAGEL